MAQTITDLKVGRVINQEGEPFMIIWNNFMRTAQRKPVMRTKLRSLISGRVKEKTLLLNAKILGQATLIGTYRK